MNTLEACVEEILAVKGQNSLQMYNNMVENIIRKNWPKEKLVEREEEYQELIMAVESKHSGETRHETALRYIQSCEKGDEMLQQEKAND